MTVAGIILMLAAGLRAENVALGPRYIDPQHGFSLRPPAGADRNRAYSAHRLVQWSLRDRKTGAIAWTLTVRSEAGPDPGVTLKDFIEAMKGRLGRKEGIRVESILPARVLGKDALYVRAQTGGKTRRWLYELWVLAEPGRFLALSMGGALSMRQKLEAVGREVASTLRLTDPKSLAEARKENLRRGRELLRRVTDEKLASILSAKPRWYLYFRGNRPIGFLHASERIIQRRFAKGLEVRTFARLEITGGQVMQIRRVMFASADRTSESWTETVRIVRDGKVVRTMSESGSVGAGTIVCKVASGGKTATRKKALAGTTAEHYLPRAMALVLPRLADRTRLAAYAFATYTTAANDFDMRTFTMLAPEKITLGARTIEAVRASDQVAADAEAATLHLQADGGLLRMRTGVGIVMEQATRSAVLRRHRDAEKLLHGR